MSRGLGHKQEEILRAIDQQPDLHTIESLRWKMYEGGLGSSGTNRDLSVSWQTQFKLAVLSLAERGCVEIKKRPLKTLEECVMHYPGKTIKSSVRKLRQELLPVLLEWAKGERGPGPKYSEADNEKFYANHISLQKKQLLSDEWADTEPILRQVFAATAEDVFLRLISKGRFLFQGAYEDSFQSFQTLVENSAASELLPISIVSRLKELARSLFPERAAEALRLKSYIHRFSKVPGQGTSGSCQLRQDALERLYQQKPEFISSLQGFRLKRSYEPHHTYGKLVHQLFDRTVFQKFSFLQKN